MAAPNMSSIVTRIAADQGVKPAQVRLILTAFATQLNQCEAWEVLRFLQGAGTTPAASTGATRAGKSRAGTG